MSGSCHASDPVEEKSAPWQPVLERARSGADRLLRNGLAVRRRVIIARNDFRWRSEHAALEGSKGSQRERFLRIAEGARDAHQELRPWCREDYVLNDWAANVQKLEAEFVDSPRFDFLRHPTVMATMVILAGGRVLQQELAFAEQHLPRDRLCRVLEEELVGKPVLMDGRYRTSHSAAHYMYHLLRFAAATGSDPANFERTVEWGAGYGGFARLHRRWHGGRPTQVLIDLPIFSLIQWLYLSTVFGPEEVSLVTSPGVSIQRGKISIVPVGLADGVSGPADLFVSTWALSESAAPAHSLVASTKWFEAEHLLLAYQETSHHYPDSSNVGVLAEADGAFLEAVGVLRGSHYAFR